MPPARLESPLADWTGVEPGSCYPQATRAIGELERIGVEAEVDVADNEPVRDDLLFDLDADVRLAEAVRHRLPTAISAGLGDQLRHAVGIILVEPRGVRLVAAAHVDRAIDGNAVGGERAVGGGRIQPRPEARVAVGLLGGRRRLLGRQVGGGSRAYGEQPGGRGQEQVLQQSHNEPHCCRRPRRGQHLELFCLLVALRARRPRFSVAGEPFIH